MVAPIISDAKRQGRAVAIYYLTNGDGGKTLPIERNRESIRLLTSLGVMCADEVQFLGDRLGISDGTLHCRLFEAHEALEQSLPARYPIASIFTHAWEGGNPDHDAAHAVALGVSTSLGLASLVRQVAFYRAPRSPWFPFVLFAPLQENGAVSYYRVGFPDRIKRLLLSRFFPSQVRTFARFVPFLLIDAVMRPGVPTQRATTKRLTERPMMGRLRYERIGYLDFSTLKAAIDDYWRSLSDLRPHRQASSQAGGEDFSPLSEVRI